MIHPVNTVLLVNKLNDEVFVFPFLKGTFFYRSLSLFMDHKMHFSLCVQLWPTRNIVKDDHCLYIGSPKAANMISSQRIFLGKWVILFVSMYDQTFGWSLQGTKTSQSSPRNSMRFCKHEVFNNIALLSIWMQPVLSMAKESGRLLLRLILRVLLLSEVEI